MAATITLYNNFRYALGKKLIDLSADTFKVVLLASGYTPDVEAHTSYSDLTNELSTANGYTNGGQALANTSWTQSTVTVAFDADDTVWTASGGSITARYAVVFDDTSTNDDLVAYILLDDSPSDVTASDGETFTLVYNASGIVVQA